MTGNRNRVKSSTSFHRLNGDRRLGPLSARLYSICNRVNNLLPRSFTDRRLDVRGFACEPLRGWWERLDTQSSPSRILSDLFWMTLPWETIQRALGGIHILDAGCGSGGYGVKLQQWSSRRIDTYAGCDVRRSDGWGALERRHPFMRFYQSDMSDVARRSSGQTNFIMSQSAIEHFNDDLRFFDQISRQIASEKKQVLQVHLCPSRACLRLYGCHGIRQYTPRTLSKITRRFNGFSRSTAFGLGGEQCNRLHAEYISGPRRQGQADRRLRDPGAYERRLHDAVAADLQQEPEDPAFYALVIHSFPEAELF